MKEKLLGILGSVSTLSFDWSSLGWDTDGCPDGEECEDFERELKELEEKAKSAEEQLKKIDSDFLDRLAKLTLKEQETLIDFLENSENYVSLVGREARMTKGECILARKAIEKFNGR